MILRWELCPCAVASPPSELSEYEDTSELSEYEDTSHTFVAFSTKRDTTTDDTEMVDA